jgi:hypothetical protein
MCGPRKRRCQEDGEFILFSSSSSDKVKGRLGRLNIQQMRRKQEPLMKF